MNTTTKLSTLTLSMVMATLAVVQIGTADFALAGKEQFKRAKPHVNVASRGQKQGISLIMPIIQKPRRPLARQGRDLKKFQDGTSNTLMFGESSPR